MTHQERAYSFIKAKYPDLLVKSRFDSHYAANSVLINVSNPQGDKCVMVTVSANEYIKSLNLACGIIDRFKEKL